MNRQLVIAGLGGQGILTLVKLLSQLCEKADIHFMATETHGLSKRGGSVVSFIRMGDYAAPLIPAGQADTILALDYNEGLRYLDYLREDGLCYSVANKNPNNKFKPGARFVEINAAALLKQHGLPINSVNVFMLGACITQLGFTEFSTELVKGVVRSINPKHASTILQAYMLGYASQQVEPETLPTAFAV
jgi:indolepyruvate ferredoxin oxidoreductase beta subunit